jgi:hypothetical protein
MSTLKLKSIVRRGTMLGAALAVVAAAIAPASLTFADALNPLTNRSLTLSSSSPGWDFKDGSGNTTYAQPNSGANGKQTGNTFSFNVSTDSTAAPIKGFTFQYCTTSAGSCLSPGNNGWTGTSPTAARNADSVSGKTSDLNVVAASPSEVSSGDFSTVIDATTGIPNRSPVALPALDNTQGNFVVMKDVAGTWTYSGGWAMTAVNNETGDALHATGTGANNYISLTNATGDGFTTGQAVRIIFFGTNTNYITNPGAGAFFVKINDYNNDTTLDDTTLVDGGVTVANVMNQSIEIQTKVLETMDFSVGTVDPYTLASDGTTGSQFYAASGKLKHGQCDPILKSMDSASAVVNTLQLGDQSAENSLRTDKTYSTHSYWRLSSNSSAGATVYYSGVTLKNTVGDEIAPIGTTASSPLLGTPQFGLALANGTIADNSTTPGYAVNYNTEETATKVYENGADNGTNGIDASVAGDTTLLTGYHAPQLAPLAPAAEYDQGAGVVNATDYGPATTAKFAFDPTSNTVPTPIASENAQVVDCVTAKVRYIANIAATTPAGIYTTKINYIAAPQY